MADIGILKSDEKVIALTKRIKNVYLDAYKLAIKNHEEALKKLDLLTDKNLIGLTDDEKKAKREAFKIYALRTEKLAQKIGAEIAKAGELSALIIQGELTGIYELNYNYGIYSIMRQSEINLDYTIYNKNEIAVILQEKQSPYTKIAFKNLGKDKVIVQRMQDSLIVSILNGEGYQKSVRKLKEITMMSTRQANRIIQTERNRVQSQGRQMSINEGTRLGLEVQKKWVARMVRTRESHVGLNGVIVDSGEKFKSIWGDIEFPADPNASAKNTINCFCYIMPIVASNSKALAEIRQKFGTFDRTTTFDKFSEKKAS